MLRLEPKINGIKGYVVATELNLRQEKDRSTHLV